MSRFTTSCFALLLAASALGATQAVAVDQKDSSDRIDQAQDSSRLLSIGGDTTEILYALGLGDKIVAVDSTSQFPPEAAGKKNVGYMRALSTEGVLSTGATLILASAQSGPPEVMRALKASSVPVVVLPENESPDSLIEKVRLVGQAVGATQKAEEVASQLAEQFRNLESAKAKIKKPVRTIIVLSVSSGRALVGGAGTTADVMLKLAGAQNAATAIHGYKPISDEALIELAPEAVIAINRQAGEDIAAELAKLPGFKAIGAGTKVPIISMGASYLLGFGPRAPQAARELMSQLYPSHTR